MGRTGHTLAAISANLTRRLITALAAYDKADPDGQDTGSDAQEPLRAVTTLLDAAPANHRHLHRYTVEADFRGALDIHAPTPDDAIATLRAHPTIHRDHEIGTITVRDISLDNDPVIVEIDGNQA